MTTHTRLAKITVTLVTAAVAVVSATAAALGREFPEDHPALRLYPSPDEWQRRIATTKQQQSEAFAAARADFDLAIRSAVILYPTAPRPSVGGAQRHSANRTILEQTNIKTRADILTVIDQSSKREGFAELAEWYREHIDELAVEDTTILHAVLADVLLNGWDDWSGWQNNDRLDGLRKECPEPHVYYAWKLAAKSTVNIQELNGLGLRLIVQPDERSARNLSEICSLLDGASDISVIDYLLHATTLDLPGYLYGTLAGTAKTVGTPDEQEHACRDLWVRYLSSPHADVRANAAISAATAARGIRIRSKGQDNSETLQTELTRIADTDSDALVRDFARSALENIRTAEWRDDP